MEEGVFLSIVGCVDEIEEGDSEDDEVEVEVEVDWRVGFEEDDGICRLVFWLLWYILSDCLLLFLLFDSNGWRSKTL